MGSTSGSVCRLNPQTPPRKTNSSQFHSVIPPAVAHQVTALPDHDRDRPPHTPHPFSGRPQHLVRLLYNEQVVPLPGCGAAGESEASLDCDLEEVLQLLQVSLNSCVELGESNGGDRLMTE